MAFPVLFCVVRHVCLRLLLKFARRREKVPTVEFRVGDVVISKAAKSSCTMRRKLVLQEFWLVTSSSTSPAKGETNKSPKDMGHQSVCLWHPLKLMVSRASQDAFSWESGEDRGAFWQRRLQQQIKGMRKQPVRFLQRIGKTNLIHYWPWGCLAFEFRSTDWTHIVSVAAHVH